jgi:hypothetical protein
VRLRLLLKHMARPAARPRFVLTRVVVRLVWLRPQNVNDMAIAAWSRASSQSWLANGMTS